MESGDSFPSFPSRFSVQDAGTITLSEKLVLSLIIHQAEMTPP